MRPGFDSITLVLIVAMTVACSRLLPADPDLVLLASLALLVLAAARPAHPPVHCASVSAPRFPVITTLKAAVVHHAKPVFSVAVRHQQTGFAKLAAAPVRPGIGTAAG